MSRVLVVDDEASICWALREFLGDLGHEVDVASSAEEGLELAGAGLSTPSFWTFACRGSTGSRPWVGFASAPGRRPSS